jgi:putative cell wall-binding protein
MESSYPVPASGTSGCVGGTDPTVILATDSNYPDALAASYLAGQLKTGILLTPTAALSTETANAIRQEGIQTVDVVGGTDAISSAVISALQATPAYKCGGLAPITSGKDLIVNVIAGPTEYDTAQDIATTPAASAVGKAAFPGAFGGTAGIYNDTAGNESTSGAPTPVATAILATGTGFQDASAASVLGYANAFPVLLTTPTSLAVQATEALADLNIKQVIVMGGPDAISNTVVTQLTGAGVAVLRIAGADYTDTAQELARFELSSNVVTTGTPTGADGLGWDAASKNQITLARGDFYSDALAGAPFAALAAGGHPEPILLTFDPNNLGNPGGTSSYLPSFLENGGSKPVVDDTQLTTVNVLGGTLAVTDATLQDALNFIAQG